MWRRQQCAESEEKVVPMDTVEQEHLINSLQDEASHQDLFIRRTFSIIFLVVAVIFCGCLVTSLLQPFAMVHQQRFEGQVSLTIYSLYYIISILSFTTAAVISQYGIRKLNMKILLLIAMLAFLALIYWSYIFYILGVSNIQLYWLPLGNVTSILLSLYVDSDMKTLANEVEALAQFKYDFKTA